MVYIYCFKNKITGQKYIGRTNNLSLMKNEHESDAHNPKSRSYNHPFQQAIRYYGINNFDCYVLDTAETHKAALQKEECWIANERSLVDCGGYNIQLGERRRKKAVKDKANCSSLLTHEEIADIQNMLMHNEQYDAIVEKYAPRLKLTMLSNINHGYDFKDSGLSYPLKKDFSYERTKLTPEEAVKIRQDIKDGIPFSEIAEKYRFHSIGCIGQINKGKCYYDEEETYPLIVKGCADKRWIEPCIKDILFTEGSFQKIARKYGKAKSTIQRLATGLANKNPKYHYPLRQHLTENRKIYLENHI